MSACRTCSNNELEVNLWTIPFKIKVKVYAFPYATTNSMFDFSSWYLLNVPLRTNERGRELDKAHQ